MECKVALIVAAIAPLLSINRNIVECKVVNDWKICISHPCINRNIVECKAGYGILKGPVQSVLIETLWNVK